jgi:hypothetical protein
MGKMATAFALVGYHLGLWLRALFWHELTSDVQDMEHNV